MAFSNKLLTLFPPPRFLMMPAVGVDISDSSIKYLEVISSGGRKHLGRFGDVPVPSGVVEGGEIKDPKRLGMILSDLRRAEGFSYVRVSLPEEKAYFFQTQVPDVPDEQIRSVIEFKLEENVPIVASDAVFDYEIIETGKRESHLEVSVAVFPKATISAYREVIRQAGMIPLGFVVESQAIADSVIPEKDQGTFMLVDFGKFRTGLAIVSHRVLHFTSTLEVRGDSMTDDIMKVLKISAEEAEKFKNEEGITGTKTGEAAAGLMATVTNLKNEIERHYTYWLDRPGEIGGQKVDRVILVGGNGNLAGLPEYLSSSLHIPVEVGNVWRNIFSFHEAVPGIDRAHSLGYATAVGLALAGSA